MIPLSGFSIQNVWSYPLAALNQIYSSLIAGSGNIRAGLLALKAALWGSAPTDQAICATLQDCPAETILNTMARLQVDDQAAFLETCSAIRNHFTPEQRKWIAFEKQCKALIDKKWQTDELSQPEKERLDQAYEQVLTKLFDPQTGNHDLQRIAALTESFSKAISRAGIEGILKQVLSQQPGNRQAQWERLAQRHLGLCVSLSGILSTATLAEHGVHIRETLLARLGERTEADRFLHSMESARTRDNSALHHAVGNRFPQVAGALLKANPDSVDLVSEYAGNPLGRGIPLMRAVYGRNAEMVRLLLSYNTRVDWRNAEGDTPLKVALSTHIDFDIVDLLLKHGANVNTRDKSGYTPLLYIASFAEKGYLKVVSILRDYHADVNQRDTAGNTALMLACMRGNRGLVELLLLTFPGVDLNAVNTYGKNALSIAEEMGHRKIAELLLPSEEQNQHAFS